MYQSAKAISWQKRGHLEFLGLPDPDHNPAVVSVAWATQKGNLLLLGKVLRVLGVEDGVVNALCKEPGQSHVWRGHTTSLWRLSSKI